MPILIGQRSLIFQGSDFLSNHSSFFDFAHSPRQTSSISTSSNTNGYLHSPLPARPMGTGHGNGGLSNNNSSAGGPGLIGSSSGNQNQSMGLPLSQGGSSNGSAVGNNGGYNQLPQILNLIGNARASDLTYISLGTLRQYQQILKYQLDVVDKAILSHKEGHPSYGCLSCAGKGKDLNVTKNCNRLRSVLEKN